MSKDISKMSDLELKLQFSKTVHLYTKTEMLLSEIEEKGIQLGKELYSRGYKSLKTHFEFIKEK